MIHKDILPAEHLRKYVRCFRILKSEEGISLPQVFKIIPDGRPGLVFQEYPEAFSGPNESSFPRIFLHGLSTKAWDKRATKSFCNIHVDLQSTALRSVFGLNASTLTDTHADLGTLIATDLTERLLNTASPEIRIQILSSFFTAQIRLNRKMENPKADKAAELLRLPGPESSLAEVRAKLNVSERGLERLFTQTIGVPPKLFARMSRFQRSLQGVRNAARSELTGVAFHNDYSDQSHFIREFKQFTGISPYRFRQRTSEQVENFPSWK